MGKFLVTVWTAILLILLQTDVSLSETKPKPSGSSWNGGSQLHPGYPPHSGSVQFNGGYLSHHPSYPQYPNDGEGDNLDEYEDRPGRSRLLNLNMMELAEEGLAGDAAVNDYDDYSTTTVPNLPFYPHFPNCDEERWWSGNRQRFTDHTYEPIDSDPVPFVDFVRDCVNATMRGHIKPKGNQMVDEMETRVGSRMVHEICTERYRLYSRPEGGEARTTDEVESQVLDDLCTGAGVTVLLDNLSMLCIITFFLFFLIP
ncbi:major prion protein homolog [Elgaria multicarinata webbii]|uniref:major prion protein homolog n=1 Tax=Elgaria multicarinata webbii TaxID=159646 RepID=UPI002FCD29E6